MMRVRVCCLFLQYPSTMPCHLVSTAFSWAKNKCVRHYCESVAGENFSRLWLIIGYSVQFFPHVQPFYIFLNVITTIPPWLLVNDVEVLSYVCLNLTSTWMDVTSFETSFGKSVFTQALSAILWNTLIMHTP